MSRILKANRSEAGLNTTHHLTVEQRAWLSADLERRYRQLTQQAQEHAGGLSRTEHAHEVLEQDADDAPQRESERELDLALTDRDQRELDQVGQALLRVKGSDYGICIDCGAPIAFERLRIEPWAVRCIGCASAQESATRKAG
jgi:DnaK suppressor protein